jgi:carbamoyltransferase
VRQDQDDRGDPLNVILGINAYHGDSSACLLRDGRLIAAAEEERFRRIKHWAGFPTEAIKYCLNAAGVTLGEVDIVAINQDPGANLWRKVRYTALHHPSPFLVLDRIKNKNKRATVLEELARAFPGETLRAKIHHVEHHLAHLASAFLVSPFKDATVISVDGFGDFASAAWGIGHGEHIELGDKVYFPHSLGIFYQALTQYLGFHKYGDEYKVMGLAPFGRPMQMGAMRKIVRLQNDGSFRLDLRYFRHHKEKVEYQWENGEPTVGILYSEALVDLLGPARRTDQEITQRHQDIAHSLQSMYEEALFHLLARLHERHGLDALALAGGCAMNSVANGKIYRCSPFRSIYIQSAAGDAGGAIGAAFSVSAGYGPSREPFHMDHAYWGPEYDSHYIEALLRRMKPSLDAERCVVRLVDDEEELVQEVARNIEQGLVTGWFQGRMEWGPRALGNRSILADPRRSDMKEILNLKIKRRESFRPFAPSVLREHVADWFETDDDVPFMMQVYQVREDRRAIIPAVTHVDGSGRLQTVQQHTNPRYYRLIETFRKLTGVPMVLNTSFNENEPVVCKPEEALDCFLRTHMDVLVLGSFLVRRS